MRRIFRADVDTSDRLLITIRGEGSEMKQNSPNIDLLYIFVAGILSEEK